MDLRELLRHLQATTNMSVIQRATGLNRRTMARYRTWASAQGLLDNPLPPLEDLQQLIAATLALPPPPQILSSVAPYRELVVPLHRAGVAGTAIWHRMRERGYQGALSSVYRFLHRLEPADQTAIVRVEREPGSEAQVDFGYAGRMLDPTTGALRKTWACVMLLAYSPGIRTSSLSSLMPCQPGSSCMCMPLPSSAGCPTGWDSITSKRGS